MLVWQFWYHHNTTIYLKKIERKKKEWTLNTSITCTTLHQLDVRYSFFMLVIQNRKNIHLNYSSHKPLFSSTKHFSLPLNPSKNPNTLMKTQ